MKKLCGLGTALFCFALASASGFAQSGGIITTIAGNGTAGFSGDGGAAISAEINGAVGIAVDGTGNVYVADTGNHRIRKINPEGSISTVAGGGNNYPGDGGPATSAQLNGPVAVAVDLKGTLYILETGRDRIRKITPDGIISTFATGFHALMDIAIDSSGNLYVRDAPYPIYHICKITPGGMISTVASSGDGSLEVPVSIAIDSAGNLYFSDWDLDAIRKLTPEGTISTVAGGLWYPTGLAVDSAGNIYFIESNSIRKVTPEGTISTVAGGGNSYPGDGGPATLAQLEAPGAVAVDLKGNLYIADKNRIRKVENGNSLPVLSTYFPQVAIGGGWTTLFTFTNTGLVGRAGNLVLSDSRGNPLIVNGELSDSSGTTHPIQVASSFSFVIPSGGTVFLSISAAGDCRTGWAQVESTGGSLSGIVTYEYAEDTSTKFIVTVPQSQPIQLAAVPVDIGLSKRLAYAIANPNSQGISLELVLMAQDGDVVGEPVTINLGPGEQTARYLLQDQISPKFRGTLVFRAQSGQTFVACTLLDKQGLLTAIPLFLFQ